MTDKAGNNLEALRPNTVSVQWHGRLSVDATIPVKDKLKAMREELEEREMELELELEREPKDRELKQMKQQLTEIEELLEEKEKEKEEHPSRDWWMPHVEFLYSKDKQFIITQWWDSGLEDFVNIVPSGAGWKKTYEWNGTTIWTRDRS